MLGHVTGDAAATFEPERGRLFGLAYRLLGSASDAKDVLQDAFLQWAAKDRASIASPGLAHHHGDQPVPDLPRVGPAAARELRGHMAP